MFVLLVLCSNQRIQRGSAVFGATFFDEVFECKDFLDCHVGLHVMQFASHDAQR
jgi:hypothetical protein